MAVFSGKSLVISLMVVLIAFAFIGESLAAKAPPPKHASAAVAVSPALATVVLVPFTWVFLNADSLKSEISKPEEKAMEVFSGKSLVISLMAVLIAFAFIGESLAAKAPAPGPVSAAVAVSPALAAAVLVPFTWFLLGSIFKI
ncbi:hypothetical protein MRB53_017686 [Persea americana]|uniref:Uncharacterized protein n=1 Tax=Persea americana TaxID=3435 RepID=A0ACC2M5D2_PERAE|nr:hypothetical protein MRB53_017686 [Persea americana]